MSRFFPGALKRSLSAELIAGYSPPIPQPAKERKMAKLRKFQENALAMVASESAPGKPVKARGNVRLYDLIFGSLILRRFFLNYLRYGLIPQRSNECNHG
jgi:hypothetical protein